MHCFNTLVGHYIRLEFGQPAHRHSQRFLLQKSLVGLWCQVVGCQCGLHSLKYQKHAASSLNVLAKETAPDASVSRLILTVHHSALVHATLKLTLWTHRLCSFCIHYYIISLKTGNGSHFTIVRVCNYFSEGSSASINYYVIVDHYAKICTFIHFVTIISLSHLTIRGTRKKYGNK